DLISSMLTAIRGFVNDSFSPDSNDDELHEVQFGDERIILESGTAAYIAAVTNGVEPDGFRSLLRTLVNELHIQYKEELQEFDGDQSSLPDLRLSITQFIQTSIGEQAENAPSTEDELVKIASKNLSERRLKIAAIVLGTLLLGFCLFYGWLTLRLLPYAVSGPQPTPLPIVMEVTRIVFAPTSTAEPTLLPTDTPIPTLTTIPSNTPTSAPTMTSTPSPSATATPTTLPTGTATSLFAEQLILDNPVWSRETPDESAPQYIAIPSGTPIDVLQTSGVWLEISWEDRFRGLVTGWIKENWVKIDS
ncbi:MAG: hypothetical protein AB8G95_11810, partial [Anaerolineae bacterium]